MSSNFEQRAKILQNYGLKPFDSLHDALTENCNVDVFLTTDVRLIKISNRVDLNVKVANPTVWLMEVTE